MIKYPAGFHTRPGFVKIAVEFPHQLFAEIITMGMKENKAFSPMVVELVKCGKLCLDESDQHEKESV
jgi:hypothetical protein